MKTTSYRLAALMAEKYKYLTVKFPLDELVEFHVAVEIFNERDTAGFVYKYAKDKIDEAKLMVSEGEFQKLFEERKKKLEEISKRKSLEAKNARAKKQETNVKNVEKLELVKANEGYEGEALTERTRGGKGDFLKLAKTESMARSARPGGEERANRKRKL